MSVATAPPHGHPLLAAPPSGVSDVTVVVAGRPDDPPLAAAWVALVDLGLPGVFADLSRDGVQLAGSRLLVGGVEVDRGALTGLYLRAHGALVQFLAATLR